MYKAQSAMYKSESQTLAARSINEAKYKSDSSCGGAAGERCSYTLFRGSAAPAETGGDRWRCGRLGYAATAKPAVYIHRCIKSKERMWEKWYAAVYIHPQKREAER